MATARPTQGGRFSVIDSRDLVAAVIPIRPGNRAATLTIGGRSVLEATIRALRAVPMIGPIVLALEGVDAAGCLSAIERPQDLSIAITATKPSRWQAIEAALDLAGPAEMVVLHEPDRPLVAAVEIMNLLRRSDHFDAMLTAVPVHATIKRVASGRIVETVSRGSMRAAQAPWVVRRAVLAEAIRRATAEQWPSGDELELARMAGIRVHLTEGDRRNVPIASWADARFAEMATAERMGWQPGERAHRSPSRRTGRTRTGVAVVVMAAGRGERMSSPTNKIFLPVGGIPILARTLQLFESMATIDTVVLVTRAIDRVACAALVEAAGASKVREIVTGGDSRHASEARGLSSLESDVDAGLIDTILVHDAVRPFVTAERVEAVVLEARSSGAAILAIPAADGLVTVAEDGAIQTGGDDLWVAQTPQAFRAALVLDAHRRAADDGFLGTDTCSVVERTGHPVSVVEGQPENIKITTPDDLLRAAFIAAQMSGGRSAGLGTLTPRV